MQILIPNMNDVEEAVNNGNLLYGLHLEVEEVLTPNYGDISNGRFTSLTDLIAEEDDLEERDTNKSGYDVHDALVCYADPSEAFKLAGKEEEVRRELDISKYTRNPVNIGLEVVTIQKADEEFSIQDANSIELGQGQRLYISPQGEYMVKQEINRTAQINPQNENSFPSSIEFSDYGTLGNLINYDIRMNGLIPSPMDMSNLYN